jgi:hypothetical protein
MLAGIITICAGTVCIALGAICLAIYMWRWRRSKDIPGRRLIRQAAALFCLFLANFVVAGGLLYSAIMIDSCYCVSVTNQNPLTLKSASIYGGGPDILFGDISPGSTVRRFFWVQREEMLMFEAMCGNDRVSAIVLDEYVTDGINIAVTVDASRQVTIREK